MILVCKPGDRHEDVMPVIALENMDSVRHWAEQEAKDNEFGYSKVNLDLREMELTLLKPNDPEDFDHYLLVEFELNQPFPYL